MKILKIGVVLGSLACFALTDPTGAVGFEYIGIPGQYKRASAQKAKGGAPKAEAPSPPQQSPAGKKTIKTAGA
jgi:hypothetical protein